MELLGFSGVSTANVLDIGIRSLLTTTSPAGASRASAAAGIGTPAHPTHGAGAVAISPAAPISVSVSVGADPPTSRHGGTQTVDMGTTTMMDGVGVGGTSTFVSTGTETGSDMGTGMGRDDDVELEEIGSVRQLRHLFWTISPRSSATRITPPPQKR